MNKLLIAGGVVMAAFVYLTKMKQSVAVAQKKNQPPDTNLPQTITTAANANYAQYNLHDTYMETYGKLSREDLRIGGLI